MGTKEEVETEFARNFYFGCEADDPLTALAFDARLGPRLKPVLGSDISHWDVQDMTTILEEAFELVEHGVLSPEEFRDFTFTNAVELHCGMNPDFFKGTVVELQYERNWSEPGPPLPWPRRHRKTRSDSAEARQRPPAVKVVSGRVHRRHRTSLVCPTGHQQPLPGRQGERERHREPGASLRGRSTLLSLRSDP